MTAPANIFTSVDFPDPFFPTSACTLPLSKADVDFIQRAGAGIIFGDIFRSDLESAHLGYLEDSCWDGNRVPPGRIPVPLMFIALLYFILGRLRYARLLQRPDRRC